VADVDDILQERVSMRSEIAVNFSKSKIHIARLIAYRFTFNQYYFEETYDIGIYAKYIAWKSNILCIKKKQ
jgi:hypothetical protein